MSLCPKSLEVGRCYLTDGNTVGRVIAVLWDRRIQYEWRGGQRTKWKAEILSGREFAQQAEREVPCDFTPERGG
jgi:hypothetical protein